MLLTTVSLLSSALAANDDPAHSANSAKMAMERRSIAVSLRPFYCPIFEVMGPTAMMLNSKK